MTNAGKVEGMKTAVLVVLLSGVVACGKVVSPDGGDAGGDPCASAACVCTTATEDADCGAHEYCETGGPGRSCQCVAGYTKGASGCVWTGSIQDTAVKTMTAWTPTNGALLNPTAVGGLDPGEAAFLPSALCGLASIKQTFDMPSYRKAEPLVLELSYKNQLVFQQSFDSVLTGVAFGSGRSPLPNFGDAQFHTARLCVPEGGYADGATTGKGAPVTLALGPYQQPTACPNSMITNFAIDHVAVVPANAGECGTKPGFGPNWDAEGSSGWKFTVSGSGTSSGGFVGGLGVGGTRAAQITLGQRCDGAVMETTFNAPSSANPALDMFVGTAAGSVGSISIGGGLVTMAAPAGGTSTTLHMCLPPSLRGQTMTMAFSANGGAGVCNAQLNMRVFADNVRVVDDPACGTDSGFTDLGFEQGGTPLGVFGSGGTTPADAIVRTGAAAHSGTHYLSLESRARCSSSGYTMLVTVPPSVGTAGPALTLFANVGVNPDAATFVRPAGGTGVTLTEGGGYQKYTVCLNPRYVGRPQPVTISHSGGSGVCDTTNYTQQNALIDDIAVTTDPACPAQ